MKILIISGFLGAGKTTFIKTMTHITGRSFVIYENEYGASGVDTKILENEDLSVWESTEKCVCCTGKGDFAQSIITISATLDPDYLIVEPTGVAKLCSILDNLKQVQYERVSVLSPITIVDCVNWKQQKKTSEDVWVDQISGAGTIVLSKMSKSNVDNTELIGIIKSLNKNAKVVEEEFDSLSPDFFNCILKHNLDGSYEVSDKAVRSSTLVQLTLENVRLSTPAHLSYILDLAVMGAFGKISRAKGFLQCGTSTEWLKFDLVERQWAITGMEKPTDGTAPVAVFIGESLQKDVLRQLLIPVSQVNLNKRLHSVNKVRRLTR